MNEILENVGVQGPKHWNIGDRLHDGIGVDLAREAWKWGYEVSACANEGLVPGTNMGMVTQIVASDGTSPFSDEKIKEWKEVIKFAIVRNPYDYLASLYFHGDKMGEKFSPQTLAFSALSPSLPLGYAELNVKHGIRTFEEFVYKFADPQFPWAEKQQHNFLFWQLFSGEMSKIDCVIRYEKLREGLELLFNLTGTTQPNQDIPWNPPSNVSVARQGRDYRKLYTSDMIEVIKQKCDQELQLLGYNFDGPIGDDSILFF